jgi:hypothetical protein
MAFEIVVDEGKRSNNEIQTPAKRSSASLDLADKQELESAGGDGDLETGPGGALEWDSDPGNARNWPTMKKVLHTTIPALYGFVV